MKKNNQFVWPLIVAVQLFCAGCSSLAIAQRSPVPTATPPATSSGQVSEIQRASYIEERYREVPEDTKPAGTANPLDALSSKNIKKSFKKATGRGPDPKYAKQVFGEAEAEYQAGTRAQADERKAKFVAAAEKYIEAADRWPDSVLEEDALFMSGECYFFADQYDAANKQYELLVKKHGNTRHMDIVDSHRFAIAQFWLDLDRVNHQAFYELNLIDKKKPLYDTSGHAFRIFDRIRVDDPTGKLSDDATLAAANAHFAAGRYMKADDLYTDLRKTYPSSEHQFLAHFLGLKSKLNSYQGADYSGDALNEAEKLVKQIRKLFPQKAEEEKEFLAKSYAEIRYKKAERLWEMARYHELRQEYGAANHYLEEVVKDYSDTPFGEKSQPKIAENAAKPPAPTQRLPWLVDSFPQRQPAKPLIKTDDPGLDKGKRR